MLHTTFTPTARTGRGQKSRSLCKPVRTSTASRKQGRFAHVFASFLRAIMSHDDHDIFDGAGSYPDQCRLSPVMLGLQRTSQKFRLLFQHHTTLRHCRQHRLFGKVGQSAVMQMGPRLACLVTDARVERTDSQVIDQESWDMMFERLDKLPATTTHLMVIFAVPFSFIRVKVCISSPQFMR